MDELGEKDLYLRYLGQLHEAIEWKLDGLGEYDLRRPLTPTGTNLLGLAKHVASVELGYAGEPFGRPHGVSLPWFEPGAEENSDLWATEDETSSEIMDLLRRALAHVTETITALPLDAEGRVPHWVQPEVTLRQVVTHLLVEVARHAGHIDLVRELIDGAAGLRPEVANLPERDRHWWQRYREQVQESADRFRP